MRKASRNFAVIMYVAAAALITGCGTMPSTVKMPTVVDSPLGTSTADLMRYKVGGETLDQLKDGIMPVEKTIGGVKAQILAHKIAWRNEQNNLSRSMDGFNNVQFGGVVTAALGAIASSVDVAKVGAGVAGGAAIWQNHYQLAIQAENYRLASDAMECVYQRVEALPLGFWSATYKTPAATGQPQEPNVGEMLLSRAAYGADANAVKADSNVDAAYDTLQDLFFTINSRINNIRERLITAQSKVKLAAPSATDIQTALITSNQGDAQAGKAASDLKSGANEAANLTPPSGPKKSLQSGSAGEKFAAPMQPFANIQRYMGALKPEERQQVQAKAQNFSNLSTEAIKQALKLPADLTTCTKLIGG
jgi:hypothetical protein